MRRFGGVALAGCLLTPCVSTALTLKVDCDKGQTINGTLAKLDKQTPTTLLVKGSCTEYVQITGFDGLTLKGNPRATLIPPEPIPDSSEVAAVLIIDSSRNVTVDGFDIQKAQAPG